MRLEYFYEEQPLGTAGGVKACRDFLGQEDFIVISGDCVCDFDLADCAGSTGSAGPRPPCSSTGWRSRWSTAWCAPTRRGGSLPLWKSPAGARCLPTR